MADRIGKLKDGREVFQNHLPLDTQIQDFRSLGIEHPYLASPDDVALIRIEGLSNDYSRTSMMPIRARKKPTILTRISEFMSPLMAEVIMDAHRQGKHPDIFLEDSYEVLAEKAKTQLSMTPEDRDVHVLEGKADNEGKFILTPEMADTRFILRTQTSRYFEDRHTQIPFYDLPDDAPKGKAIANYLWFIVPRDGSELNARYRYLDGYGRAFGVRKAKAPEGALQNSGYDLTRIRDASDKAIVQALSETNLSGIVDIIRQRNTENLLEILRKNK